MKSLIVITFIISIFVVGCGYKTNPIYVENNSTKSSK